MSDTFHRKLIHIHGESLEERHVHPLLTTAFFNLDFLCIHPFRDGNGRVSRLLFLLQCHRLGYEVGRYISLERLIECEKTRYYETLEESSKGWHDGEEKPWPYVNYLLSILKAAYQEFESRIGTLGTPRGAKTDRILSVIGDRQKDFSVSDLQRDCPGIGVDMIRKVLKDLQAEDRVTFLSRGRSARWKRTSKWQ
jgi:hypothetical protein